MEITQEEANRIRQWFNSLQDVNPAYLEPADLVLYEKIKNAAQQYMHTTALAAGTIDGHLKNIKVSNAVSSNTYIKFAEIYMDSVARHYDPVPQESAIIDFAIWLDKNADEQERAADICPADGGKHSWYPNKDNYLIYSCRKCGKPGTRLTQTVNQNK